MDEHPLELLKIKGSHKHGVWVPHEVNAVLDLLEYDVYVENGDTKACWIDVYEKGMATRVGAFPKIDEGCMPVDFEVSAVGPFVAWVLEGCPTMEGV